MNLLEFRIEKKTPNEKGRFNSSDNGFEISLLSILRLLLKYC